MLKEKQTRWAGKQEAGATVIVHISLEIATVGGEQLLSMRIELHK